MSAVYLPPQAVESEECLLGGLMSFPDAIFSVADILKPEAFYKDSSQLVYDAILGLYKAKERIDEVTVMAKMTKNGTLEKAGGIYHLTVLVNKATVNIQYNARVVLEKFLQREIIRISNEASQRAHSETEDCMAMIADLQTAVFNLMKDNVGRGFENVADIIPQRLKEYEKPSIDGLTGISSGIRTIDNITGGWQNSDLIILAARPSMGKTAFALHLLRHAAIQEKKPVGIFSLEMGKEQITDRLVAAETGIPLDVIRKRRMQEPEWFKLHKEITPLSNATIIIDDSPDLSVFALRAKAKRMKEQFGIQLLVVDYLGLMKPEGNKKNSNRTNDIGEISRGLKATAKELDIPLIALSQLSRDVEKRPGSKKPKLSDLRDSGDIEQDADMVMFLYRPEYYGIDEDENGVSTEKQCMLLIEKHRNGELGTPYMEFDAPLMRFSQWNETKQVHNQIDVFSAPGIGLNSNTGFDDDIPF